MLETYLGMRDPCGDYRLMMKAKSSVSYSVYGCRPAGGKKFNLHEPSSKVCFFASNVIGRNVVKKMCPTLSRILDLPHCTNGQLRTTAIQALRMASFSVEDCTKITRHRCAQTITKNYDPGLRSGTRANMAVAIGQAPSLKRGHDFVPVDTALERKTTRSKVEWASAAAMIPSGSSSGMAGTSLLPTANLAPSIMNTEPGTYSGMVTSGPVDLATPQAISADSPQDQYTISLTLPPGAIVITEDAFDDGFDESAAAIKFFQNVTESKDGTVSPEAMADSETYSR